MEQQTHTEDQILRSIAAGKYRDCYLVYARKSTDEPDNQKNSITYQRAENGKFAKRENLPVAPVTIKGFSVNGIISERHSGFKEDSEITMTASGMVQYSIDRPKFQRLIRFLSKGLFKGIIVLCWDRVSRNRGDDTVVRKLMKSGVDVRFVYANYEKTSAGALHMDIDGMFAEHHSRVTSEKVSITMRNLRERGICTYKAPIGYVNAGSMEHKAFDPVRSPIIRQMFEILATKEWSLADLTNWANEQGLTTVPARRPRTPEEMLAEEEEDVTIKAVSRPMTATMVHKILTNPFYTGKILGNDGEHIPSQSHAALIPEELFSKAQQALNKRRVSVHFTEKIDLPCRGLVRCANCDRVYSPFIQKGFLYLNARCRPGCPNPRRNISMPFLEGEVKRCIEQLSLTDRELAELDGRTKTDTRALDEARQKAAEQRNRRQRKLTEELAFLQDQRLSLLKTGAYTPEGFVTEENRLQSEITTIEDEKAAPQVSFSELVQEVIKLSKLLKNGSTYYPFAETREKDQMARIIFSKLTVSGNTLDYQCRNGFAALKSRFTSVCDQTVWLSKLAGHLDPIRISLQELGGLVK